MSDDELKGYKHALTELLTTLEQLGRFSSSISISEVLAMIETRINFSRK